MDNFNQEFLLIDDIMHIRLSGKFPELLMNTSNNVFQPLIDECVKNKCSKVLVDICDLEFKLSIMELFRAGEDSASLSRQGLRVAFVVKKEMIDTFFDNVVQNRGGRGVVFTNKDTALEWLQR